MSAYACRMCGADNTPEHCMGAADSDRFDRFDRFDQFDPFGGPSYRCSDGVCVCGCEECNPQTCRECGDELWS